MWYPVRLEVATLVGESSTHDSPPLVPPHPPTGPAPTSTLPPVAGSPVHNAPVFVIGAEAVNKRPKTAGVLGCGRVAPITQVEPQRPHRPSSSTPSSPGTHTHLSRRRRHTRVTPLPHRPTRTDDGSVGVTASHPPTNTTHAITSTTQVLDGGGKGSEWSGNNKGQVPTISIAADTTNTTTNTFLQHHHKTTSPGTTPSENSDLTSSYVTERIHNLVSAFSERASRVKAHITQPLTPSTDFSDAGEDRGGDQRSRLESRGLDEDEKEVVSCGSCEGKELVGVGNRRLWFLRRLIHTCLPPIPTSLAMEPQSRMYIWWLLVVSVAITYNAWVIPLRFIFTHYQTPENLCYWLTVDYLADLVYILDLTIFKPRVKYLDNGFWIDNPRLMRRYYWKTRRFRFDLAALLPLDLLYFQFGPISVFRLPRLFKIHTFWEFFNRLDTVLASPHAVRVIRTVLYMLYLIHLNTCAYFGFSKIEGIGSNRWVFQGNGNAYIRCFYFATKTATSIGKNPKPENEAEYIFMTCSWLMGVFVFALLIGQIRDIVATATRNQNEYRRVMDHTQAYLHRLNLPSVLQNRIRRWFAYTWQNQKVLDEMRCLESLPRKMRTDIAINVHIQTLSKVQLFQDCDKALLRDLVLKLQPVLYLPGDYVCKKGEVGKEMYIVKSGQVLVMGGEKGDIVLATLGEGSVFGEISLLALAGGNRRTADVRSRGFSSLFVLSKVDLQATIKDYPEAQEILKKKAKRLIQQNEERERQEPTPDQNVIIKPRENTPKLLHAVLQVVRPDSFTANVIRRSSHAASLTSAPDMIRYNSHPAQSLSPGSRRTSSDVVSNGGPYSYVHPKTSVSESVTEEDRSGFRSTLNNHTSTQNSTHTNPSQINTKSDPPGTSHSADNPSTDPHQTHDPSVSLAGTGSNTQTLGDPFPSSPFQSKHHNPRLHQSTKSCPPKHDRARQPSGEPYRRNSSYRQRGRSSSSSSSSGGSSKQIGYVSLGEQFKICQSSDESGSQSVNHPSVNDQESKKPDYHVEASEEDRQSYTQTHTDRHRNKTPPNNSDHHNKSKQTSNTQDEKSNRGKHTELHQSSTQESSYKVTACTNRAKRLENSPKNFHEKSESTGEQKDSSKRSQMRAPVQHTHSFSFDYQRLSQTHSNSPQSLTNPSQARNSHPRPSVEHSSNSSSVPHGNLSRPHSNLSRPYSNHSRASVQHSKPPSRANSNHRNTGKKSNKSDKSGRRQSATINTNATTEELLIQFGLSSGAQPMSNTTIPSSSLYHGHIHSPDSYEIFLTELSKALPSSLRQVPSLSSPLPPPLSTPTPDPFPPTPQRVSCSAIVHHEGTSSPDSSPFDAQESKL
ncbi:hypothetical protein Pmani_014920 [Petrolisthes manimaculis]|uniref:Cyclic nucleotide-binding domain-containing protein n=1 Tax=Petrolisthes manimaculis TaxID=1843537 RepID=A0AAE1PUK1_9EUCA|nr:hypothetical protein Pmani_014920 [Petrolisthes manimaculis]